MPFVLLRSIHSKAISKKNLRIYFLQRIKSLDTSKTRRFTFERKGFHRYNEVHSKAMSKKNLKIYFLQRIKSLDTSKAYTIKSSIGGVNLTFILLRSILKGDK